MLDLAQRRILVTGGAGFLGRAVCDTLERRGCREIFVPRRRQYDLTREADVLRLYEEARPQLVIHLAAEVGGIGANRRHPGRYFYSNMAMGLHLIEAARRFQIERFVQVGTVCAYPIRAPIPFREDDLWNGYPEPTNAPYGVAKRSLVVMLDAYHREYGLPSAAVVPVNLYGPGDNFDLETSHVIPGMIRRFLEARDAGAREMTCWGTGSASREFLYVDDAAEGIVRAAERIADPEPINLGTGHEITIRDLAQLIADLTGFRGEIRWDASQPDGQPRRCLDTTRAAARLDWQATIPLRDGLQRTVDWYVAQQRARSA